MTIGWNRSEHYFPVKIAIDIPGPVWIRDTWLVNLVIITASWCLR